MGPSVGKSHASQRTRGMVYAQKIDTLARSLLLAVDILKVLDAGSNLL